MASLYEYKTQETSQGHRLQKIEDLFGSGIRFTKTPLPEGYARLLVNYDIIDNGQALKPRPGMQVTKAFTSSTTTCTGTEKIFTAKEQAVADQRCSQFMLLKTLNAGTSKLRTGTIEVITGTDADSDVVLGSFPTKTFLSDVRENANFVVPQNAEIHNLVLSDTVSLARHVGAWAWNGNYYFFDPSAKKVIATVWDATSKKFIFEAHDPKVLSPKEGATWGYNVLLDDPYDFENQTAGAGVPINFIGMLPYDIDGNLCFSPVLNQTLEFEVFYAVDNGKKYRLVWDWKSTSSDVWTELKDVNIDCDALPSCSVIFSPPTQSIIIRVSAYEIIDGTAADYTDSVLAVGFNFSKEAYGSTANIEPVDYDLLNATGMTYWQNRLVVWGVTDAETMIFASEINDPTYFPYPNNCDVFDEPVKYAIPFLDDLLVFTASQIHLLTMTPDGLGWSKKCIQQNLSISDWDIHLIKVVKNMVFFRSGNYYYMIVPKAGSTTGDLALAPISKDMQNFFDDFQMAIAELLSQVYGYTNDFTLLHYYNFLDHEDIHNVYVFQTLSDELINVDFLYNHVNRTWRIYCFGSQTITVPYKANATQRGQLCSLASQISGDTTLAIPQILQFSEFDCSDYYLPLRCDTNIPALFEAVHTYHNWQMIDTGYREHVSNFKKRYREMQFVLNNVSNQPLSFYTEFIIDGETRLDRYVPTVVHETDPTSPNYGLITIEYVLADPLTAPGSTVLDEWQLDVSVLPDVSFWKARQIVSGKGYTPRYLIYSKNEERYELQNISWVYRQGYSR